MKRRPPPRGDPAALLTRLLGAVGRGDRRAGERLVGELMGLPPTRVAAELARQLERSLGSAWENGWQPEDLVRVARNDLGRGHQDVLRRAIAAQASAYEQWGRAVAPEWMAQLDEIGAVRDWDPAPPWPLQGRSTLEEVVLDGTTLLVVLGSLPRVPRLMPPPSQWHSRSGSWVAAGRLAPGMLAKIRALLAKAESTDFDAEAEAFTTKAQELMTRHRIDRVGLAREARPLEGEAVGRRVGVENPYAQAKAMLVGGIARANSCRAVWSKGFGFATVFGFPEDVEGVEELYTSLLVQATSALQREGSKQDRYGRSRTARFRRSFLVGFAARISERLREATDATVHRMEQETGRELVPMLHSRERAAEEAMNAAHSHLRAMSLSISDGEGYRAGTRLADEADLGLGPDELTATSTRRSL